MNKSFMAPNLIMVRIRIACSTCSQGKKAVCPEKPRHLNCCAYLGILPNMCGYNTL